MLSLNNLLDSLGFETWMTILTTFILPIIALIGILLCSLSTWIFFNRRQFVDSSFVYYRLLCLVYIIQLVYNIPFGLLFSPHLFPKLNTNLFSTIYQVYYIGVSNFLYHYEDTLQIAILLTRMKMFSPLLKKYFTPSPPLISLALLITCLCIDFPLLFGFQSVSMGSYSSLEKEQNLTSSFYYFTSSTFSTTPFGNILLGVTNVFLNVFVSLIVGVTLNVISLIQYRSYLKERNQRDMERYMESFNLRIHDGSTQPMPHHLTTREKKERDIEKNMLYMILSLCTISILSRVILMFNFVYFYFYYSFFNSLLLFIIADIIFTLVPTVAIFVFYSFNKLFRKEFNKKFRQVYSESAVSNSNTITN